MEKYCRSWQTQVKIWHMRIACCVPKAMNLQSEYVILTAFPLQQSLHKRASLLRLYVDCVCYRAYFSYVNKLLMILWKPRNVCQTLDINKGCLKLIVLGSITYSYICRFILHNSCAEFENSKGSTLGLGSV
jgi:hypothetical protein